MTRSIDLSREPAPPFLGWILLSVGLAAAFVAFAYRQHQAGALAEAERQTQARLDRQREHSKPVRAAAPSPAEIRLLAATAESRAPWLATLRTIEATARDPVYLRAVTFEPDSGLLRLEAEASSFADALAYAKELDESESLHPAWLRSHEEVVDPARARPAVRFAVVARWNRR